MSPPSPEDFEQLGQFYLGRGFDLATRSTGEELLLYDARDLTTHAVCVGMTGSGKTGLGISLLEEAAIDGIPSIVIDPKGDMGNLLLNFPGLTPEEFAPWIDPGEAERKGRTLEEHSQAISRTWREGLAEWGQGPERVGRLAGAVDMAVYTPGSSAGRTLSVLSSFDAPPEAVLEDREALADRIQSSVSGLLALLALKVDPVRSREAVLMSNLLQHAWREGRGLSLEDLIREIQAPPFETLGVLDLESFFPAKERFELAMALNSLLASPGFSAWLEGEPLDVARLLHTPEGKPRISVLSIAHLSESERMFFVTLLLNEVVTWMRTQSGTTSLRALLYMDEIFGYFPPTREPPSKRPMLTLLKQARAFGLGVVLATQNPVDLDYKGLSNTGTWFIGRLQTDRDRMRVLDGLEGALSEGGRTLDRGELDRMLSNLEGRVFLMNNVHENGPVLFRTRWALSYLRGPLTREQIKRLRGSAPAEPAAPEEAAEEAAPGSRPEPAVGAATNPLVAPVSPAAPTSTTRPAVPSSVRERFVVRRPDAEGPLVYRPMLVCEARLHHANTTAKVDQWTTLTVSAPLTSGEAEGEGVEWEGAQVLEGKSARVEREEPEAGVAFGGLPPAALRARSYASWGKALKQHLYQHRALVLWRNREYRLVSEPGESQGEFRVRVTQAAHEKRDATLEKLRKRYGPKLDRVRERIRKAEQKVGREEQQYEQQKTGTLISFGTTLLGSLFGRKTMSVTNARSAGASLRSAGRTSKEKRDIERALEDLEAQREVQAELEVEFQQELASVKESFGADQLVFEELVVRPRKGDLSIAGPALVWFPWSVPVDGAARPAS